MSISGMTHWKAAKRVSRYLLRTKKYMLKYKKSKELETIASSYSDFIGCIDSRKSTKGYIYLLTRGAISWKSAKQVLITFSTMTSEYIACYKHQIMAIG